MNSVNQLGKKNAGEESSSQGSPEPVRRKEEQEIQGLSRKKAIGAFVDLEQEEGAEGEVVSTLRADARARIGEVGKCVQGLKSLEGESSSLLMSKYTKIIITNVFSKRKDVPSSGPKKRRNDQVINFPPRAFSKGQEGQELNSDNLSL